MSDKSAQPAPMLRRRHSDARPAGLPMTQARRSATAQAAATLVETLPRAITDSAANELSVDLDAADTVDDHPAPPPAGWLRGLLPAPGSAAEVHHDSEGVDTPLLTDDEEDDITDVAPSLRQAVSQRRAELRTVVGERIVAARELNGLPQGALAERLDYRNSCQVSLWELGRRLIPLPMLVRVAEVVGVSADYLLGLSDEPDRDPDVALRTGTKRALRAVFEGVAERAVGEIDRVARLVGPGCSDVRLLVSASSDVAEAVRALQRLNPEAFDDLRGSATLARTAGELEAALTRASRGLRVFEQRGAELQARLRAAFAGEPARDGEAA